MLQAETQERTRRSKPAIRWRVAHKLTVASVLMVLLTLLAGGAGLWQVFVIGQTVDYALVEEQERAHSLELLAASDQLLAALDRMLLSQDPLMASTDVAVSLGTINFYIETLQREEREQEDMESLAEIRVAYEELYQAASEVDLLARQERWSEAKAVVEQKVHPASDHMALLIRRYVSQIDRRVEAAASRAQGVTRLAAWLLAGMLIVTTAIALGWRQFVFRGLSLSINELRQGVARITGGDLAHKLHLQTGDEIEELGDEFNTMAARLAEMYHSLEQQVADRTRDLERRATHLQAAAEVGHAAASLLNLDELLPQVTRLISQRFGFYHVGIFLLDETGEYAVLRAANSEGGQRMLAQGHRLKVGEQGIVGYVTGTARPRIALDVGADAVHFKNPLLPHTRSELALPLMIGGRVLGALDVQSTEEAAFTEEDVAVLQVLADQVAMAIQNARLFEELQTSLREISALYQQYSQEAWSRIVSGDSSVGYEYDRWRVTPVDRRLPPEVVRRLQAGRVAILENGQNGGDRRGSTLIAPIMLRDQVIGAVGFEGDSPDHQWSPEEIALVEAVTGQVALALENARLFEEAQGRAARERLIAEATTRMRASLDLETVLKTATHEIAQALGLAAVDLRLGLAPEEGEEEA